MAGVTVKQFANSVGKSVDDLLDQLKLAGVTLDNAEESVSEQDKQSLLDYLTQKHGGLRANLEPSRITLRRNKVSTLSVPSGQGKKNKVVSVQVRRKRTYVKRSTISADGAILTPLDINQRIEQQNNQDLKESSEIVIVADDIGTQKSAAKDVSAKDGTTKKEKTSLSAKLTEFINPDVSEPDVSEPDVSEKGFIEAGSEVSSQQTLQGSTAPVPADEKALAINKITESASAIEPNDSENKAALQKIEVAVKDQTKSADPGSKKWQKPDQAKKEEEGGSASKGKTNAKKTAKTSGQLREKPAKRKKRRSRNDRVELKQSLTMAPPLHAFEKPTKPVVLTVVIGETVTVAELAQKMSIKAAELIKVMMKMGVMATINQSIEQDTATVLVEEMGHKVILAKADELETEMLQMEDVDGRKVEQQAVQRAPVVTIMGHVDHGKTSLLDHIRHSKIAADEQGGITQHIGAYQVNTDQGKVTFLDTPGHEAFTAMRARGAKATDIVVLVVAADDGVMPQTVEAIQHARAAKVPIIVAVNKIDKPEADADKVKNELAARDVLPEDWGGDVQFVQVSAKTGAGVDQLLDAIHIQAEILELNAVVDCPASGIIIESRLDRGRGPVATVLIQNGTLKLGDIVLTGVHFGKIRSMIDEKGGLCESAGPSFPVEVVGLSGTPNAGDELLVVADERKAREVAYRRQGKYRDKKIARQQASKLENIFNQMEQGEVNILKIILKSDVQGSLEALSDALVKLSGDKVKVEIISGGVGAITGTDISLAAASNAILIGFNVRADSAARGLMRSEGVEANYFGVIYEVIGSIKKAIDGLLEPEMREQIVGLAEVREVFRSPKIGAIAGCMVTEGLVKRNNPIRVLRDNVVIFEGALESLRRFKEAAAEVRAGMECGVGVKDYNDVMIGDQIEVFERVQTERR